jgi:hypothetical protein
MKLKKYTDQVLSHLPNWFFDKYEDQLVKDTEELDKIMLEQFVKGTGHYLASLVLMERLPKNLSI